MENVTYCNNRKCTKTDCVRYYKNAPFDILDKMSFNTTMSLASW